MKLKFNRDLWAHQTKFLEEFGPRPDFFLSWEMGTGKTTATIGWLRTKYLEHDNVLKTLILSPVATLYNWQNEFKVNAPPYIHEKVAVAHGRKKLEAFKSQIVIANYEAFDSVTMLKAIEEYAPQIVICDEAHRIKNPKSKRFKSLVGVSDRATYRGMLTGTPILNSYLDIWAQFRFLDKGETLGNNFFVFRSRYFRDTNVGMPKAMYFPNWQPHPTTAKDLTDKVAHKTSRVTKDECLDLPPLIQVTEFVEQSAEQLKAYKEMEAQLITEVRSGECVATNALVRVLRMLQILSGHMQTERDNVTSVHRFEKTPRLERLMELLEELTPEHKVIVWCTFIENYRQIKAACEERSIKYTDLTGETKDRQANIDAFQNDESCRVIIANPQAGGVGVNLTAASYGIYYSRNYSLGDRLQSEARNHRGGSEVHKKITLIDLVCKNTLDEIVLQALLKKENFADNVLDRIKSLK
jgi:SNF2 family DNA or RNA helicase